MTRDAASRPLNVAVAGLGFMGATHARAWTRIPQARLLAVVSSDARKLQGDFSGVGGNLDIPPEPVDLSTVRKYRTFEQALEDPEVDAIDICLPTDRHAGAALAALSAGKHVLIEKPIALDPADGRRILADAAARKLTLMAAQVLRFLPAYAGLRDLLPAMGPVRSALFRRRCGAPDWSPWLTDARRSGGGVFDLLIHDVDFCVSLWGMPDAVRARGYEDLSRGIDVVNAELVYPHTGPVLVTGGWHHPRSYPFSMQFTVVADGATFEWTSGDPALRTYRADGQMEARELDTTDPFARELAYFADCALGGRYPALCPPEQSAEAVELMIKILESRSRGGEAVQCR